jgi:hypothetical protein
MKHHVLLDSCSSKFSQFMSMPKLIQAARAPLIQILLGLSFGQIYYC